METLKTILYFSLFHYPLKFEDICDFSVLKDRDRILSDLEMLVEKGIIVKVDDFYLADHNRAFIEKRKRGNQLAVPALKKAEARASLIAKFPFVEGVAVSGSLSKGYYDKDSDIDFFVIARPGRVWICRTLLMLYKKAFLLNSRKYFCINYFISSDHLEVGEKNRFTATEIRTLIPFEGRTAFEAFYKDNRWASDFVGDFEPVLDHIGDRKKPVLSRFTESIFKMLPEKIIDSGLRKFTVSFWKLKFKSMPEPEFSVAMKSTREVSKHHPLNFQKKVISSLNEKYEEVRRNHNIELQKEYV